MRLLIQRIRKSWVETSYAYPSETHVVGNPFCSELVVEKYIRDLKRETKTLGSLALAAGVFGLYLAVAKFFAVVWHCVNAPL
jgi:hypothetical protein